MSINFSRFFFLNFSFLDPDLDLGVKLNADPDPQPWLLSSIQWLALSLTSGTLLSSQTNLVAEKYVANGSPHCFLHQHSLH